MHPPTNPRIAITICATKSYTYALPACLRAISRNIFHHRKNFPKAEYALFLVGDKELMSFKGQAEKLIPGDGVHLVIGDWTEGENYKLHAQLTIAQMRTTCMEEARAWGADYCWSVDSDVLIPDNGLSCSIQMLEFDNGYYSIACCPYPSQGIGNFLCGRGTQQRPILPDFVFEEKECPQAMLEERETLLKHIKDGNFRHKDISEDMARGRIRFIEDWVEKNSPTKFQGDIWKVIASYGWRPRGWFDNAYPGIGMGSIVPTDWCGFGATMMNADALAAADFTGYTGEGTEDLYIVWHRWYPRGMLLCAIPHVPCDHIVRTGDEKKIVHQRAYHEMHGEMRGHLRREIRPFLQHNQGEVKEESNDGIPGKRSHPGDDTEKQDDGKASVATPGRRKKASKKP